MFLLFTFIIKTNGPYEGGFNFMNHTVAVINFNNYLRFDPPQYFVFHFNKKCSFGYFFFSGSFP